MNIFQRVSRLVIKKSFHLSVWVLKSFNDCSAYKAEAERLKSFPEGTLGKDIANCLEENNLQLVPRYESHDLKHVLLDFKMTPVDEIRMQAFMIGNGNYSPASFSIFIFGALLLPDLWKLFYQDFYRGRASKPISTWSIEEYAHCQTLTIRNIVFNYTPPISNNSDMKLVTKFGAYTAIALGFLGMLFCLPFLFSSSMTDVVGAGFPFLGGAIIFSAGLLTLSNLSRLRQASLRIATP